MTPPLSVAFVASIVLAWLSLTSCDRMITPRSLQTAKDADAKAAAGEFLRAVQLYESALDDTKSSADVHYRLGLLYDDKMNDPLNALHHFKRYLTLAPAGGHASEVKDFMKRDELALVTTLSGDSIVTRAEAARLKNENLTLRKEIEDQRLRERNSAVAEKGGHAAEKNPAANKRPVSGRSYVVQSGDTLASISRKVYKSRAHWQRILKANRDSIDDPQKLQVGQTLTIP